MGMPRAQVLEINGDEAIMGIIELCYPRIQLDSELQFIDFRTSERVAIKKFMAVHGPANEGGARRASALQSSSTISLTPQRDRRKNTPAPPRMRHLRNSRDRKSERGEKVQRGG
jgi:hypothetical protein